MIRKYFLAILISILASISVLILRSIAPELVTQQAAFFLVGLIVFFTISKIKYAELERLSPISYFLLIILLIIALFSEQIKGSARWIVLPGGFHLQPSQIAIPLVMLSLTWYTKTIKKNINWTQLRNILLLILIPGLLIYIEPDFGSTMIFLLATGSLLFFLPLSIKQYLSLILTSLLSLIIIFSFLLKPHQKQRILSFKNASVNTQENYNAQQSLIAVGSGKFFGRGLGLGIQSHLRFLPERQTDFIFASIAEETGFLGSITLVITYFLLNLYIWHIAKSSSNLSQQLYCYAIMTALLIQTIINIGMNSSILPITGVTLPLVSYGGSSIIANMFSLGIIQSIALEEKSKSFMQIR
ncbi:MAG: FtsW/RodA/SpoVE family cell cycle protein [Patescibacteria group bacterium]